MGQVQPGACQPFSQFPCVCAGNIPSQATCSQDGTYALCNCPGGTAGAGGGFPQGGSAGFPQGGESQGGLGGNPFPFGGSAGIPQGGSAGFPQGGSAGFPQGGSAGISQGGSAGVPPPETGGTTGGGPDPTADSVSKQGSCTVQQYTQGVPGGQDYVNPTVYYPTDCPEPFPGVVAIPGFTEAQNAINQWGTFLASHGFVAMMVDTAAGGIANTGVQPPARATGLWQAVQTLQAENARSGSPLAGKIDTGRIAVMGHSMGGGGTLIAANAHPELKAAIGLCPWNPGGTYPQDTVPSLIFAGTADILVAPSQATGEYQSIPATTPKCYSEFTGGTHFVSNTPLGAAATDKVVARFGLSWFKVHLAGDARYQQFLAKDATNSNFDIKP
jgi:dienelactone hydrolase